MESLVRIEQNSLMISGKEKSFEIGIFPAYGYENTVFRLIPSARVKKVRLDIDGIPGEWLSCPPDRAIALNKDILKPGIYSLKAHWSASDASGEKNISYVVRDGWIVGDGQPVACAADNDRFYIARPAGIDIWSRAAQKTEPQFLGNIHLPGLKAISEIAVSTAKSILAIGSTEGWLYLCDTVSGAVTRGIRVINGDRAEPVTNMLFAEDKLHIVIGATRYFVYSVQDLFHYYLLEERTVDKPVSGMSFINGEVRLAFEAADKGSSVHRLPVEKESSVSVVDDYFLIYTKGGEQRLKLPEEFRGVLKLMLLSSDNGMYEFLLLTANNLFVLTYDEESAKVTANMVLRLMSIISNPNSRITSEGRVYTYFNEYLFGWSMAPNPDSDRTSFSFFVKGPELTLGAITAYAYSDRLNLAALGDEHGKIALFDINAAKVTAKHVHQDIKTLIVEGNDKQSGSRHAHVTALAFIPDTDLFLSAGMDCRLYLHEIVGTVLTTRWSDELSSNIQQITVIPEMHMFFVSEPYTLSLWTWGANECSRISKISLSDAIIDPVCFEPQGRRIIVGDWDGVIHVAGMGKRQGLKWEWKLEVSKNSLFAISLIDENHIIVIDEKSMSYLVDLNGRSVVALAPFFRITTGSRKTVDYVKNVRGRDYIVVNPIVPSSLNVRMPLYLFPLDAMQWSDGKIWYDRQDYADHMTTLN